MELPRSPPELITGGNLFSFYMVYVGGGVWSGDYSDLYESEYSHKWMLSQSSATQDLILKKIISKCIAQIHVTLNSVHMHPVMAYSINCLFIKLSPLHKKRTTSV